MPASFRTSTRSLATAMAGALALAAGPAEALSGRLGTFVAEGPGVWLQVRHPIKGTEFGIHLAGSTIDLDVVTSTSIPTTNAYGFTEYTERMTPDRVSAQFYEWGVVGARPIHTTDRWTLALSTGLLGGLIDGNMDARVVNPAEVMILVPAFVEADWQPLPDHRRFGLTFGAGGVWTTPGDEDELYPEVSAWRWEARTGLRF